MRDVATPFSLVVESNENALFLTCKFAPNTSLDDLRKLYLDYQKKNISDGKFWPHIGKGSKG